MNVALPQSVEITPALTDAEIEQEIEAEQPETTFVLPSGRPIVIIPNEFICVPVLVAPSAPPGEGIPGVPGCVTAGMRGVVTGDPVQEGSAIRYPAPLKTESLAGCSKYISSLCDIRLLLTLLSFERVLVHRL